jgi:hypothetical protein
MAKIDYAAIALQPSPSVLCKLGSIAVHVDEAMSSEGHPFDVVALQTLIIDPEVTTWLAAMGRMAMIPLKRNGR